MLKFVEVSVLYDFYGQLLTNKQQKVFELYYAEDLSLGEISHQLDITRQAVHDNLKRAENLLHQYEKQLKLVEKYKQQQFTIQEILREINRYRHMPDLKKNESVGTIISKIEALLKEMQKD